MGNRFLISRLSALGDVVHTLPVATAIKEGQPDAHVAWVVDPRFADVVRCCRAVDEVLVAKPGIDPRSWRLARRDWDVALDMQGLLKSAALLVGVRAPVKLGYHWQREGAWLFTARVLPDPTSFHVVDQYVDVAREAGGIADEAQFALEPTAVAVSSIRERLAQVGIERPFVVMNPAAGWVTKRWPPQHFAALIDLVHDVGMQVVLIGGRGASEEEGGRQVMDQCAHAPVSMIGSTSILDLIALISLCAAHVGGDTGSTHIAAALKRPAVGLYSITRPERSCPYGQIHRCLYHPDGLAFIEPGAVFETLQEALK